MFGIRILTIVFTAAVNVKVQRIILREKNHTHNIYFWRHLAEFAIVWICISVIVVIIFVVATVDDSLLTVAIDDYGEPSIFTWFLNGIKLGNTNFIHIRYRRVHGRQIYFKINEIESHQFFLFQRERSASYESINKSTPPQCDITKHPHFLLVSFCKDNADTLHGIQQSNNVFWSLLSLMERNSTVKSNVNYKVVSLNSRTILVLLKVIILL